MSTYHRVTQGHGAARGFTLVELSVVLVIIGVVTAMAMSSGVGIVNAARTNATVQKMAMIDQALMAYRTANDRLPCPASLTIAAGATNYGVEGAAPGNCTNGTPAATFSGYGATNTTATAAEGTIPTYTLGLPSDVMYDGWGNRFRYAVDISMTSPGAFSGLSVGCVGGAIQVNDANGNARTTGAIYALVSHGPNGHGGYTSAGGTSPHNAGSTNSGEQSNCQCNGAATPNTTFVPTFVQMDPVINSATPTASFDDIVSYKERWQMMTATDTSGTSCVSSNTMFVSDQSNNRVQLVTEAGAEILAFGTGYLGAGGTLYATGSGNGQMNAPNLMAIDKQNNVWVADQGNHRVQQFNSSGSFLQGIGCGYGVPKTGGGCTTIGNSGSIVATFNYPSGVAVDSSGNIWVADSGNNRLQQFNSSGSFLQGIAGSNTACTSCSCTSGTCGHAAGSGSGDLSFPYGIAIDSSGNLWVSDENNYRVVEYSSAGSFTKNVGTSGGSGNGQFLSTAYDIGGLAFDKSGNVWVVDRGNSRVQEFNATSGAYMSQFGSQGTGNGQLEYPLDIAVDKNGNFWVADNDNNRVEEFTSSGSYASQFGTGGTGNGQFNGPTGINFGLR